MSALSPQKIIMALAYGAKTTYSYTTGGTLSSYSFSHTTSGTDRVLLVTIFQNNSTTDPTAVTYNGVAMTMVTSTAYNGASSSIWKLVAPATGANTVAVTLAAASYVHIVASYWTGGNAVQNGTANNTLSPNPSIVIPSASINNICVDFMGSSINAPTCTPNGGQTNIDNNASGGTFTFMTSYKTAGASSTTMGWSTSNYFWAYVGCEIVAGAQSTAWTKTLTETLVDTDTLIKSTSRSFAEVITDTATLITLRIKNGNFTEIVTNTATMLRTMARTFTETVTNTATALKNNTRVFLETFTNTDTFASLKTRGGQFVEIFSLTDVLLRIEQRIFTEIMTLTATATSFRLRVAQFTESFTNTDTLLRVINHVLSEVLTMVDIVTKSASRVLSEATTLTATALKMGNKILSETITTADTFLRTLGKTYYETIRLVDQLIVRLNGIVTNLWAKVARTLDSWNKIDRN
jgi:hypothetical protein